MERLRWFVAGPVYDYATHRDLPAMDGTSMFLTKDLLLHWQWGERCFMQQLVDGDLAANNGGWQWSAGTGTDAAPYFRIFNPVSQGEKFHPHGEFVRRWVPELAPLPDDLIHQPWQSPLASVGGKYLPRLVRTKSNARSASPCTKQ